MDARVKPAHDKSEDGERESADASHLVSYFTTSSLTGDVTTRNTRSTSPVLEIA